MTPKEQCNQSSGMPTWNSGGMKLSMMTICNLSSRLSCRTFSSRPSISLWCSCCKSAIYTQPQQSLCISVRVRALAYFVQTQILKIQVGNTKQSSNKRQWWVLFTFQGKRAGWMDVRMLCETLLTKNKLYFHTFLWFQESTIPYRLQNQICYPSTSFFHCWGILQLSLKTFRC